MYNNVSFSKSQLKKKNQYIYFHQARECMADDIIIVYKVDTNDNLSDLLTKSLPSCKHVKLRSRIMYLDNPNISWDAS